MLYQQAKLRARHGSDARLADVADARKATAAAVESACDTRGHWLRYGVNHRARADGGAPLVTLAGPGLDADAAPGISLPDDDASRLVTSEFLRARCVAEADRVSVDGLIRAFNATAPESRRARASSDPRHRRRRPRRPQPHRRRRRRRASSPGRRARRRILRRVRLRAVRQRRVGQTPAGAGFPTRRNRRDKTRPGAVSRRRDAREGARGDGRARAPRRRPRSRSAAPRKRRTKTPKAKVLSAVRSVRSLGATTRACAATPALVAELRRHARARASGSNSSGFDSDSDSFDARSFGRFGLSEEEEASARVCATASDAHFARGDAYAGRKAADAEMNGRGASAAAAADTNRRAALRAYAAGESTWPSSARSALAATRTARALVAENPNTRRR